MKTVKEVSELLGVSYQTIYNHLKKNEKEMKGCTHKKQGTTYIDDEGIRIIKESMGLIQVPTIKEDIGLEEIIESISDKVTANITNQIKGLKDGTDKEFEDLKRQVEQLQEQNKELLLLIKNQEKKNIVDKFIDYFKK